ncbi:MAG: 50S ribosomal protein L28 [Patescibacteria group bacterium]
MAKVCHFCQKRFLAGNNVSHSNRKTRRRFNPNLQLKKISQNNSNVRVYVCAKCIKSQLKVA